MSVPTEPGWYWWRESLDSPYWQIVWIQEVGGRPPFPELDVYFPLTGGRQFLPDLKGEFGPRIPSPERLEAMEKVLAAMALNDACPRRGGPGECIRCAFCGGIEEMLAMIPPKRHLRHAPGCPWVLAQEAKP